MGQQQQELVEQQQELEKQRQLLDDERERLRDLEQLSRDELTSPDTEVEDSVAYGNVESSEPDRSQSSAAASTSGPQSDSVKTKTPVDQLVSQCDQAESECEEAAVEERQNTQTPVSEIGVIDDETGNVDTVLSSLGNEQSAPDPQQNSPVDEDAKSDLPGVQESASDDRDDTPLDSEQHAGEELLLITDGINADETSDAEFSTEFGTVSEGDSSASSGQNTDFVLDDAENAESIADYMEQLLARSNQNYQKADADSEYQEQQSDWEREAVDESDDSTGDQPTDSAESGSRSETSSLSELSEQGTVSDGEVADSIIEKLAEDRPSGPSHVQDRDAVRERLDSLREVANQSARASIAQYTGRTLRNTVLVKGILTVIAFTTSAVLFTGELWGTTSYANFGWMAAAVGAITGIESARLTLMLHRLGTRRERQPTTRSRSVIAEIDSPDGGDELMPVIDAE